MKIIYKDFQKDIYQDLVRIICVLAKVHTEEATDAIVDAFHIAQIVGVDRELERIAGLPEEEMEYDKWTDMFCLRSIIRNDDYKPRCSCRKCGEM